MIQSPGFQSGSAIRTANLRLQAELEAAHAEISRLSAGSVLAGIADAPDVVTAFRDAHEEQKRAIIDLLLTVTLLRSHSGGIYFDPTTVRIEQKLNPPVRRKIGAYPYGSQPGRQGREGKTGGPRTTSSVQCAGSWNSGHPVRPTLRSRPPSTAKESSHADPNGGHP